jgi:N6-L-threonylcarbamoyladenine synthase
MKILSIETSCDETGIALVEATGGLKSPKFKVLENLVASQIKIHRPFGGVVPNLAKREHIRNLPILFNKLIANSSKSESNKTLNPQYSILNSIDLIAVTVGPGLEPALWTGINFAKELHNALHPSAQNGFASGGKPNTPSPKLIGANHMEGHLYSFLLPQQKTVKSKSQKTNSKILRFEISDLRFPAVVLLVSGGHTILLNMKSLTTWKKLGETRDDAVGEAFDKVARLLKLPYPGGPEIEKIALKGDPEAIKFPRPMIYDKNYDFSFSGLKTSVLYYLRDNLSSTNNESVTNERIRKLGRNSLFADVAASFQAAAVDVLVTKTMRATREFGAKSIILCGGVAANQLLRKELKANSSKLKAEFYCPSMEYNTDNGAMIAAAGYMAYLKKKNLKFEARGNLGI